MQTLPFDKVNPCKVDSAHLVRLEDLSNIGMAMAESVRLIGIHNPQDLAVKDPLQLYEDLSDATGTRQDPCVLNVFKSVVSFIMGGPPQLWWSFTAERKRLRQSR